MTKIKTDIIAGAVASVCLAVAPVARAAEELHIGVLGVMSGPAASWGLVNKYCAETTAKMYNDEGGVKIGDKKYMIKVSSIDDKNDSKLAVAGAERLVSQGIKYIIGPNVDHTAQSVRPVVERAGAIHFPYAFDKSLYIKPASNSVLAMIASYQSGPIIYKYLKDKKGVNTVAFVARNESDPLRQREEGIQGAEKIGLKLVSSEIYEPDTTDFFPVMNKVIAQKPDLIVLSGVAPAHAPQLLKTARELGYKGQMSTETAQDAKILSEGAGEAAIGFIFTGGASTPAISSSYMNKFIKVYKGIVGEWNDEAGTKVYALEIILRTLQAAGPEAIDNTDVFKKEMAMFNEKNPLLKAGGELKFVGENYFGQRRQIGVPLVVNTVGSDGKIKTLFVGSVS